MPTPKYKLKCQEFKNTISSSFGQLREEKELCDLTLVSEQEDLVTAHKIVLSTSSKFFKSLLGKISNSASVIYLGGVDTKNLHYVLDYIYKGEVQLLQEDVSDFLIHANKFKIHGLDDDSNHTDDERDIPPHDSQKDENIDIYDNDEIMENVDQLEDREDGCDAKKQKTRTEESNENSVNVNDKLESDSQSTTQNGQEDSDDDPHDISKNNKHFNDEDDIIRDESTVTGQIALPRHDVSNDKVVNLDESDSDKLSEEKGCNGHPDVDTMDEIDKLLNEEDEHEQEDDSNSATNQERSDTLLESIMDSYVTTNDDRIHNTNQEEENNSQRVINPFKSLVSQVEQARIWVQKCNKSDDGNGKLSKIVSSPEENSYLCTYSSCKKTYKTQNGLISHLDISHQNGKEIIKQGYEANGKITVTEKIDKFFREIIETKNNTLSCKKCGYSLVPEKVSRMKEHIETHLDGLNFECGLCDQSFQTRRKLRGHLLKTHRSNT